MKIQHEGGQLSHLCFHPTSCDRTWFFALDPPMSVVVRAAVGTDQLCWACCGIWKSLSGREIEPRAFANYYSSVWNVMFALLSKIQLDTQTRDWKYSGSRGDRSSANTFPGRKQGRYKHCLVKANIAQSCPWGWVLLPSNFWECLKFVGRPSEV